MIHPLPEIHTEEDSDEEEENSESDYPPAYWDKIIGYIHADYKVFEVRPVVSATVIGPFRNFILAHLI